jgi:hypothetical protein
LLLAGAATPASAACHLRSPSGDVQHVIVLLFDNVHLHRDDANVPSDLEQMPHLLQFLRGRGTIVSRHHTPLISHTGTDLLTALTGVYGDRHGISVSNSYRYFRPDGSSASVGSFAYWTDPADASASSSDHAYNMVTAEGKNAPAPWVAFTRAGCDVGAVASANTVLENVRGDVTTLFGAGSPQALEAARDPGRAAADFEGIAVHCAAGSALCKGGAPDLLPDEPGGYAGYQALFGHAAVAPQLGPSPILDLSGNVIADSAGHVGFPGFDGMSPSVSLGYVAAMQEAGVPVTFAYVSDAHDDHAHGRAFGPGEAGYLAQLAAYDDAFARFFARLAADGITEDNTLFVLTADEGDHFVGGKPSPVGCDGVTTPCTYAQIGEIDANLTGLLAQAGVTTPLAVRSDSAPELYVTGAPSASSATVRTLARALGALKVDNPLTGAHESLFNFLADPTEMGLLHLITGDPQRTPTLLAFARPDYYVTGGPANCTGAPCIDEQPGYAWNHGDVSRDINTTWLGVVGPGVRRLGVDDRIWSDHADLRPTLLALVGLSDDYVHQGRVLTELVHARALPRPARDGVVLALGRAYKQLNAPLGALAQASLRISTVAQRSGDASFDGTHDALVQYLTDVRAERDAIAGAMESLLEGASFYGVRADPAAAAQLVDAAETLVDQVRDTADFVSLLPF